MAYIRETHEWKYPPSSRVYIQSSLTRITPISIACMAAWPLDIVAQNDLLEIQTSRSLHGPVMDRHPILRSPIHPGPYPVPPGIYYRLTTTLHYISDHGTYMTQYADGCKYMQTLLRHQHIFKFGILWIYSHACVNCIHCFFYCSLYVLKMVFYINICSSEQPSEQAMGQSCSNEYHKVSRCIAVCFPTPTPLFSPSREGSSSFITICQEGPYGTFRAPEWIGQGVHGPWGSAQTGLQAGWRKPHQLGPVADTAMRSRWLTAGASEGKENPSGAGLATSRLVIGLPSYCRLKWKKKKDSQSCWI